jgi:N-acetyl sugar amidotransferase
MEQSSNANDGSWDFSALKDLKRCSRCVLPETVAGIAFDEQGVCNICKNAEKKQKMNFVERETELKELIQQFKGSRRYDCLVPFSGGKDSSYTLLFCKKYGLNPLAYNFNNHFQTEIGRENMLIVLHALSVDIVSFTPGWDVCKKLCVKGLEKIGDFCWFCNSAIDASSVRRAIIENIPLVIFGESVAEYDGRYDFDDSYEKMFRMSSQEGIPETEFIDEDLPLQRLECQTLPPIEQRNKLKVIYLGNYIKWDKDEIVKIVKKELGWKEGISIGTSTNLEHLDCAFCDVRGYTKYLKRGFGSSAQRASIKVREGKLSREEALKEASKDGQEPACLNSFLEAIGLTRKQYFEIVAKHKKY